MELKHGFKETEVGVIPNEWDVKSLGGLFDFGGGFSASRDQLSWEGHCYLHYGDIHKTSKTFIDVREDYANIPKLKVSLHRVSPRSLLSDGDVVFVDASEDDAGASKHVVIVNKDDTPFISGLHTIAARSKTNLLVDKYKRYCFQTANVKSQFLYYSVGTKVTGISKTNIAKILIPLPPPREQRTIAEALSDVDALIDSLDKLIAKKRDIKQGAMQELLSGRKRLPGFSGVWDMKRLGRCILQPPDYGINAAAVPYSDALPSYVRITDISEDGKFSPNPRVSVKAENAKDFYLCEGDIVLARTGASVGKSYLHKLADGQLVFAGFLIRVRANPEILVPSFLSEFLKTKTYWDWVRLMSMRSGQPGINGKEYAQLTFAVPSVSEQKAISGILSDLDAEILTLEQRREKTVALKQGMMQELLTGRTRLV